MEAIDVTPIVSANTLGSPRLSSYSFPRLIIIYSNSKMIPSLKSKGSQKDHFVYQSVYGKQAHSYQLFTIGNRGKG